MKILPTNENEVPENSTNLQNSQQLVEIWWDRLGIVVPSPLTQTRRKRGVHGVERYF